MLCALRWAALDGGDAGGTGEQCDDCGFHDTDAERADPTSGEQQPMAKGPAKRILCLDSDTVWKQDKEASKHSANA